MIIVKTNDRKSDSVTMLAFWSVHKKNIELRLTNPLIRSLTYL